MRNYSKSYIFFLAIGAAFSATAYAEEKVDVPWFEHLSIGAGITAAIQGTSGNNVPGDATAKDRTDYSYTMDIELESALAEGHSVFVHIETGEADGVNDNFSTNTSPNYDPYNTHSADTGHQHVTMSQAFYEGLFRDGSITLDVGKMDTHSLIDENNLAGDETSQFMAGIFVRLTGTLFAELDNYYAPTARLLVAPVEMLEFSVVAANSNTDSLGEKGFIAGQVNLKPGIAGLEGNYRFYYILDGRDYTDMDTGDTKTNRGFGTSIDQMLTEDIGVFFRYGSQDKKLAENAITEVLAGGVSISGGSWNRGGDSFGVAYGVMRKNGRIATSYSGDQKVIEVYYRWQAFDRLAITPDVQFHSDLPRDEKRNVTTVGVRAQLDF